VDVHTQVFVENLLNRSVRLDVLATDSADRKMNVEIQRADKGAGRKRARYNSSMMDANLLRKGEDFDDGSHILYVNGEYRDETPIGKLMHDFSCTDPADMYYDKLADRVRFFKESKEGVAIMCKVMEDMRTQAALERAKTVVYRMLAAGKYSLEEIADMTEVSLDEVKKMKAASESFNH
ncbi:MAG: nuclease, partial [Eubacterium sp.]|nr:nuclease [Eubacterium sp.]